MMERDGWRYQAAPCIGLFNEYRRRINASELSIQQDNTLVLTDDETDDRIQVIAYPMKSFAAALNAANAIIEGVEG